MSKLSKFLFGKKEVNAGIPLWEQLQQASMTPGNQSVFGQAADYNRNLLSNDSADINAFEAPLRREFNEDILPGIAERYAGMGSGSYGSSGQRNQSLRAGRDLGERLASIRSGLRQNASQNLFNMGQFGIQSAQQRPETGGFLGGIAQNLGPAIGTAAGFALNPIGSAIGGSLSSLFGNGSQPQPQQPQMNMQNMPRQPLPSFGSQLRSPYNISS